jgi:hypothetical protein
LREFGQYGTSALEADSKQYLGRVWPRLNYATGINWSNRATFPGSASASNDQAYLLEGDQCLVFFLGGIQAVTGGVGVCQGFSKDKTNPANANVGFDSAFYEFASARLVIIATATGRSMVHFSYLDPNGRIDSTSGVPVPVAGSGMPFLYFSSYKTTNGYNRYYPSLGNSDCNTFGVWPYAELLSSTSSRYQSNFYDSPLGIVQ